MICPHSPVSDVKVAHPTHRRKLFFPSLHFVFGSWIRFFFKVVKVAQLCLTLSDPMDCPWNSPGQNTGVGSPFSRASSQPRNRTHISCIACGFFTSWATREAQQYWNGYLIPSPSHLPNSGIEPGSPALQADSVPAEFSCWLVGWEFFSK